MLKLLFDLDGTLTAEESVIAIVRAFGLDESIVAATRSACVAGEDYRENFGRRVDALRSLPVNDVAGVVANLPLRCGLVDFVNRHADRCCIVSNNLDCWCSELLGKFRCAHHLSRAAVEGDRLMGIAEFADKPAMVRSLRNSGYRTVYVGDGANDLEAMRAADLAIAVGFAENPCPALADVADYTAHSETELLNILEKIIHEEI